MSNPNRPPLALTSQRPEDGSAHVQPDATTDEGDPYKPEDRQRLNSSFRAYARHQGNPGLDKHLDDSRASVGDELWIGARSLMDQRKFAEERALIIGVCESPIEELLVEPLLLIAHQHCTVSCRIEWCDYGEHPGNYSRGHLRIEPQFRVLRYRVDFFITYVTVEDGFRIDPAGRQQRCRIFHESHLVIECDGRQFHDITPAQKERDRRKSQDLQALGYMVFPFGGSEITTRPYRCAYKSLKTLLQRPHAERWADAA